MKLNASYVDGNKNRKACLIRQLISLLYYFFIFRVEQSPEMDGARFGGFEEKIAFEEQGTGFL